jgi:hypothetical protein
MDAVGCTELAYMTAGVVQVTTTTSGSKMEMEKSSQVSECLRWDDCRNIDTKSLILGWL